MLPLVAVLCSLPVKLYTPAVPAYALSGNHRAVFCKMCLLTCTPLPAPQVMVPDAACGPERSGTSMSRIKNYFSGRSATPTPGSSAPK